MSRRRLYTLRVLQIGHFTIEQIQLRPQHIEVRSQHVVFFCRLQSLIEFCCLHNVLPDGASDIHLMNVDEKRQLRKLAGSRGLALDAI